MRRWTTMGLVIAMVSCGPTRVGEATTSSGGESSDATQFSELALSAAPRKYVAPSTEARAIAPVAIDRPGEVDILIGAPPTDPGATSAGSADDDESFRSFGWYEFDEEDGSWDTAARGPQPVGLHAMIDVPYQAFADEGSYAHLVALTPMLEPAAGADVFLNGRAIGRTDAHGTLSYRVRPRPGEDGTHDGRLLVRHDGHEARLAYSSHPRTPGFEETAAYVYTDRGIYRPGETILVRTIAWSLRSEYRPLDDAALAYTLVDGAAHVVGGGRARTDSWGVATIELPLPSYATTGLYELAVDFGDEHATTPLMVEEFVPPSIELMDQLPRFVRPGPRELAMTFRLGYFSGGTFHRARVALDAMSGDDVITSVAEDFEGPGPHRLAFDEATYARIERTLVAAHSDTIVLRVRAEDEQGRHDSWNRFIAYTDHPYSAVVELDKTRYAPGAGATAVVRVVDLDERPVRDESVELEVPVGRPRGFVAPAADQLPTEPSGRRRRMRARTDAGGIATFAFTVPVLHAAYDSPELVAYIAGENVGQATMDVRDPLPMMSEITTRGSAVAEIAPGTELPATAVHEGEDVPLTVTFPADVVPYESVVHADLTDSSGSIIMSSLLPVTRENGHPVARGTIRAPTWGSALITLFCTGRKGREIGLLSEGQELVVQPLPHITVTLDGIPDEAAPGDTVNAMVHVRDRQGSPVDAILGLSLVDQAVLSRGDPLRVPPFDRFYNPQRKVLASTGAQTLTWPVVSRTWGETDDRDDIGWPPEFGYHAGIVPVPVRFRHEGEGRMTLGYGAGSGSGMGGIGYGHGARIVVRTEFPDTALWAPRVLTEHGDARVSVRLPDAITRQNLTAVASDRTGGVAVVRAQIPVRQRLHVESGLPASLNEGDRIEVPVIVRNHGTEARRVRLSLTSSDLVVTGEAQEVSVGAGDGAAATFVVEAQRAMRARYEIAAEELDGADPIRDVERREVLVKPAGAPVVSVQRGTATSAAPFAADITLGPDDRASTVRLGVTMPSVLPAFDALADQIDAPAFGAMSAASHVLSVVAAYRYAAVSRHTSADEMARLTRALSAAAGALGASQHADGGFGWYASQGPSVPYATLYGLRAFVELMEVGFPVSEYSVSRAERFVLHSVDDDGAFDMREVAVWEGDSARVASMGSAEAFEVLSRVATLGIDPNGAHGRRLRGRRQQENVSLTDALTRLLTRLRPVLSDPQPDVLVMANLLSGLHHIAADERGMTDEELAAHAVRLADFARVAHWEPGWFSAWGGRIEAAALVLDLLEEVAPESNEAIRLDAARFLLHARASFGAWHNERATAFAIRALTRLNPGDPDDRGTLVVSVDGEVKRRVEVDAHDLFSSALALRDVELSGLSAGTHHVEVSWDGTSIPRITLELRRWGASGASSDSALLEDAGLDEFAGAIALTSSAPANARSGDNVSITIGVNVTADIGAVVVTQPLPTGTKADKASLDTLVQSGSIQSYAITGDSIVLGLPARRAPSTLAIDLVPDISGRVTIPGASAHAIGAPSAEVVAPTGSIQLGDDI